jgi:hypothetical protein
MIADWSNHETGVPYNSRGRFASTLLKVTPKKRQYQGEDYATPVAAAAAKDPLRGAVAIAVGACEDNLTGRYPVWRIVGPYFEFLKAYGYTPSAAERLELAGKAPK